MGDVRLARAVGNRRSEGGRITPALAKVPPGCSTEHIFVGLDYGRKDPTAWQIRIRIPNKLRPRVNHFDSIDKISQVIDLNIESTLGLGELPSPPPSPCHNDERTAIRTPQRLKEPLVSFA
jgi:hypothetical protein